MELKSKLLFSFAFFIIFSIQAKSQLSIGLEGGGTRNYLNTNVSNLVSTEYNSSYGFTVGVPILYQINDWLSFQADPSYTQKNYEYARTDFFQGVYQDNTNSYLQLPLMAHLSFGGEKLKGFVNLGGYGGYWLSSHLKGTIPNVLNQPAYTNTVSNAQPNNVYDEYTPYSYSEKYQFNKTKDNRIELGLLAGMGISYEMNEKYILFGEVRYSQSMSDQQKKYQTNLVPRYNETVGVSLGFLYELGSKNSN
ncbi:MAG: porin family protein [Ginsengibacter sp.]